MKLISWNVNGIRAVHKKGFLDFVKKEKPDLLCLQETKINDEQLDQAPELPKGYSVNFSGGVKKGYSGVATFVKDGSAFDEKSLRRGISAKKFDQEGRFIISDHKKFLLYNIYFPSGSSGEERQDFKYEFLDALYRHLKKLPEKDFNRVVICGDYNICHREIDIHHPDTATKRELSGFLPDERAWMDKFSELGLIDSFRHANGDVKDQYSWWSYRAGARGKNLGWRLDYFFVASPLAKKINAAKILNKVNGSDHCPVTIELDL